MAEAWDRLDETPADHPSLPRDTEGPLTGWETRHNIYIGSAEYKVEVVGIWIDPANSQKSWGNLRAAVAHKNRARQEAQAQSSWQGGYGEGGGGYRGSSSYGNYSKGGGNPRWG